MKKLLVFSTLLLATTAQAQTTPPPNVVYKKKTSVEFGPGDAIEGKTAKPEGERIIIPPKVRFRNLVQIRTDFRDKLTQSASTL